MALAQLVETQNRFLEAKQLFKKAVSIKRETGDKIGEAKACERVGFFFYKLGERFKAKEDIKRAKTVAREIQQGEYNERALAIRTKIGERKGEADDSGNLGAKEYLKKGLVVRTEIGDRKGEAADYGNLGTLFQSLWKCDKAEEYLKKALVITTEIGDRREASCYGSPELSEIGDKEGEADDYGNLGTVLHAAGQYDQAKEYYEKALAIRTGIGDMTAEGADYGNLVYYFLEELEVIIVLDRTLYEGPFAALSEKEGAKYLSRTHRIRVVPTLTTLKTIQDSPEDYHSNTGALIISNPKVDWLLPLPGAREDAQMVGRLVGVPGLVEEEATKQAVFERINSMSLI
ncbi:G-protein-signaling modulator 1-like [Stylophora pistillata]|uniref:G-protein-signaling modulator 1-like n=1 Tax=Stylophora pistillata TaxID=50429 RepID=UPI000C03A125|nr:G-protein-signaling modulator 1-like [Stylophora pistillata]